MASFLPVAARRALVSPTTTNAVARATALAKPVAARLFHTAAPAAAARLAPALAGMRSTPRAPYVPPAPSAVGLTQPTGKEALEKLSATVKRLHPLVIDDQKAWLRNLNQLDCFEIYSRQLIAHGLAPGDETYVGDRCCQMEAHLMAFRLEDAGYPTRLMCNDLGYDNHFWLSVSGKGLPDGTIVDPTFRQCLRTDVDDLRNYEFNRNLYVYQPTCFAGPRQQLAAIASDFAATAADPATREAMLRDACAHWDERTAIDVTPQLERMRPTTLSFITRRLPSAGLETRRDAPRTHHGNISGQTRAAPRQTPTADMVGRCRLRAPSGFALRTQCHSIKPPSSLNPMRWTRRCLGEQVPSSGR